MLEASFIACEGHRQTKLPIGALKAFFPCVAAVIASYGYPPLLAGHMLNTPRRTWWLIALLIPPLGEIREHIFRELAVHFRPHGRSLSPELQFSFCHNPPDRATPEVMLAEPTAARSPEASADEHSDQTTTSRSAETTSVSLANTACLPDGEGQFVNQTLEFWRGRSSNVLTSEDARQIAANVAGFFKTLEKWAASDQQENNQIRQRDPSDPREDAA